MSLNDCRIIELPKIQDQRGNLTFVEGGNHIPFDIRRVFYLYDVPDASGRGAHAHKALEQFIIAMSGGFDVVLDDGIEKKRFHLNRPFYGLYTAPRIWATLENFSTDSICLVLASQPYEEADYIRDYDEYLSAVRYG